MYRVELKVERENFKPQPYFVFLMYRVELKEKGGPRRK